MVIIFFKKNLENGCVACSSVVEEFPSMFKALGRSLSTLGGRELEEPNIIFNF